MDAVVVDLVQLLKDSEHVVFNIITLTNDEHHVVLRRRLPRRGCVVDIHYILAFAVDALVDHRWSTGLDQQFGFDTFDSGCAILSHMMLERPHIQYKLHSYHTSAAMSWNGQPTHHKTTSMML